jgi:hypothetical protein
LFLKKKRGQASLRRSVTQDWIAALPRDKSQLFDSIVRHWESGYAMMSIALDDAFCLRTRGNLVNARMQVVVAADLLSRLATNLTSACEVVSERARHFPSLPAVEPLKTEFFRGETAQSAASWNGLLHHVLFGDRSRFFQKLRILRDTVERLADEFRQSSTDLLEGASIDPGILWDALDSLHYDFNTCLRESEVVLKGFLHAIPESQLAAFAEAISNPPPPKRLRVRASPSRASA